MIKQLLLVGLCLILALSLGIYIFQRYLIYMPAKDVPTREAYDALDMQVLQLVTADNLSLLAWYKPATPRQPTILLLHGNAGNIGYRMPLAREFITAGFGVLLLEYRGYAGNSGFPSERGLYTDGDAAMTFLHKQGIGDKQIVLYGESLGTAVATQVATQYSVCALILQSPFISLASIAQRQYPWIPLKPWDRFDTLSRIRNIHAPLLILHGTHDVLVPFDDALTLFQHAVEPKKMLEFPGRGHNDLWNDEFFKQVIAFIRGNCTESGVMNGHEK